MTVAGGERRAYPLTGPLVPGFPRRLFMVDLGKLRYRAIDVSASGVLLAHDAKDPEEIVTETCGYGIPGDTDMRAYHACLREHHFTRTAAPAAA